MPDGLDAGAGAPDPCRRYPDCSVRSDCGWPECTDRHPDDDFSDAIKGLMRAFAGDPPRRADDHDQHKQGAIEQ